MSGVPASQSDEDMKNELANIQFQQNKVTDESLESTRRMRDLCEESQEVGIRTIVMLDEQGEQLDRIEEGMDQINQDMKDAEKNLEGMEKCCGLCVLPWKRAKKFDDKATWKANDDGTVNTEGPRVIVGGEGMGMSGGFVTKAKNFEKSSDYNKTWKASEDGTVNTNGPRVIVNEGNGVGPTGGFVTKITNDAREDEMEQNLGEVSGMLGNLRNMAVDMGNEINAQNKQLDRINHKGESLTNRVDTANKRANKILRNQ